MKQACKLRTWQQQGWPILVLQNLTGSLYTEKEMLLSPRVSWLSPLNGFNWDLISNKWSENRVGTGN